MIYLTELSDLREGLYWAREITGEQDLGRSKWLIVCVVGEPPFLDGYIIAFRPEQPRSDDDDPWFLGHMRNERHIRPFRASEWEFGSRIDIPSDNDRVEHAPQMSVTERMMA